MVTGITRSIQGAVIDTSAKKRTVRAIWSTDELDHFKTVFDQDGIDTDMFASNPVILWEHGKSAVRGDLPIANAPPGEWGVEKYRGRNALIGVAKFWEGDEFSEARFQDYAAGRLRAWSVNLIPDEVSPPTTAERRARPDLVDCEFIYRRGRLAEVSAVPIPGNASALTLSVERSMALPGGRLESRLPLDEAAILRRLEWMREHARREGGGNRWKECAILRELIRGEGR